VLKLAVKRHVLTRALYALVKEPANSPEVDKSLMALYDGKTKKRFRFFVKPNKRVAEDWEQLVANWDKKRIVPVIQTWFKKDFERFMSKTSR
jgi:hypothetical protein